MNGYVCHVDLYAGKDFGVWHDEGQAHAVVMKLLQVSDVLGKRCHVFMDNFYTNPKLSEELFEKKTFLTGTV